MIPEPEDQKGHRRRRGSTGGHPDGYDITVYRARNTVMHWRGLATRYDDHAVVHGGALVLAAALHWLATTTAA